MISSLLTIGVLAITFYFALRREAIESTLGQARRCYLESGALPYFLAPILLALTVSISLALNSFAPAFMQYGWLSLISTQKSGNVLLAGLAENGVDKLGFPAKAGIGSILFLLLAVIPRLASSEEQDYRRYKTKVAEVALSSLRFGLMHMIMGISLCTALALAVCGAMYAAFYLWQWRTRVKRGEYKAELKAFQRVCALHSIYNAYVVLLLGCLLLA